MVLSRSAKQDSATPLSASALLSSHTDTSITWQTEKRGASICFKGMGEGRGRRPWSSGVARRRG